jgi:hypothetical protein
VAVTARLRGWWPDLVNRPAGGGTWLGTYAESTRAHTGSADTHLGIWGTDPIYNQSLAGSTLRLLGIEAVAKGNEIESRLHPEWISPATHRWLVYLAVAFLLLTTLLAAGRPGNVREGNLVEGETHALEWEGCVVLLLALLCSPMSGPAHFGVILVPGMCLARRALRAPWCWAFVGVAVVLALLNARDLVGAWLYSRVLWHGTVTLAALALLVGCWLNLARLRWARPVPQRVAGPQRLAA